MFSIDPVAFTVGGISVHWYGIMIALGVLFACILVSLREKPLGLAKDTGLNLLLCALPAGVLAARIYYVAFSWDYYSQHLSQVFDIRGGGLAIYGGLIGGVLADFAYCRIRNVSIPRACDLAAPAIAIGQAFGRWGNFFNQEAYGAAITNEALRFFPIGVFIDSQGAWHYATFFYESIWCMLLCAALLYGEKKKWFTRPGDTMFWYVLGYAAERVAVEGLRTDSLYAGSIRVSQLLSALLLLAAAIWLIASAKHAKPAWIPAPAALLCALILFGVPIGFAATALLAALQLITCIYAYITIRKKASIP